MTEHAAAQVAIIDANAHQVVATLTVGNHPTGVAIAKVGTSISNYLDPEVYVANSASDSVIVGFILIGVMLLGGVALVAWVARSTKKGISDADQLPA